MSQLVQWERDFSISSIPAWENGQYLMNLHEFKIATYICIFWSISPATSLEIENWTVGSRHKLSTHMTTVGIKKKLTFLRAIENLWTIVISTRTRRTTGAKGIYFYLFDPSKIYLNLFLSIKSVSIFKNQFLSIWPYMTIYDHIWPYVTIYDHICPSLSIPDLLRPSLTNPD